MQATLYTLQRDIPINDETLHLYMKWDAVLKNMGIPVGIKHEGVTFKANDMRKSVCTIV